MRREECEEKEECKEARFCGISHKEVLKVKKKCKKEDEECEGE